MTLVYRGRALETDPDVSYRDYTSSKKAADLTTDQVDALINSGLSAYADKSYVDAQDAKNATRAYIDAQDNLRLKLANIGQPNGIVPLDASGRIPPSFINAPLTQRYFRGPWSPAAYFASPLDFTTETTLFICNITDPGYPYRLMVFGEVDARANVDGEYPIINVRAGSPTGEIIAQGLGSAGSNESGTPGLGDDFTGDMSGWAATALDAGAGSYVCSGGNLVWSPSGGSDHSINYRRINSADALTSTDWQKIETQIAAQGDSSTSFVLYGRMNTAMTDMITASIIGTNSGYLGYFRGGTWTQMQNGVNGFVVTPANSVTVNTAAGNRLGLVCGTGAGGLRQFALMNNGSVVQTATDVNSVTAMGSAYRGWGFAGHAASGFFGFTQNAPASLAYMNAADAGPNSKMVSIIPVANPNMTVRSGSLTLYVRGLRSGTSSSIRAAPVHPHLYPIAFPAG